jgi:hypothetical protein
MNSWRVWLVGVVFTGLAGMGLFVGCTRDISVPVSPAFVATTSTPAVTSTPTSSPTPTPTRTPTSTVTPNGPTSTPTQTGTPTNTGTTTSTSTITATPSLTGTPTQTLTPTQTGTPTSTPLASGCVASSIQPTYTFPSNNQCFSAWGSIGGSAVAPVVSWTNSLTGVPAGSNAISVYAPFNAATTWASQPPDYVDVGLQISPAINLPTLTVISLYYMCPANTTTTSGQLFVNGVTGSTTGGALGQWQNTLPGTWTSTAITLTGAATGVTQLGLQLLYGGAGANYATVGPVAINIAAVSITLGPAVPPTSTPTPAPLAGYEWTFEDDTVDSWSVAYGAQSVAVTTLAGFGGTTDTSTYGLDIVLVAPATGNDNQVQVNGGTTPLPTFPINFQAIGATGFSCQAWFNPDIWAISSGEYVAAGLYITAGTGNTNYGGCYNGWTDSDPTQVNSPGGWVTYNYTPSGGTWTTDDTDVTALGIDINEGADAAQPTVGDVVIDNVQIY